MPKKKKSEVLSPLSVVPPAVPRTPEQRRYALKKLVALFYDFQRLRIQAGGRSRGTTPREDLPEAEQAAPTKPVIDLFAEDVATLEKRSEELSTLEKSVLKDIERLLNQDPFYVAVLGNRDAHPEFKGIGPTLAGVLLSEFDIVRAETPSRMFSFAGLAPVPARRCKKCHLPCEEKLGGVEGGVINGYQHPAKLPSNVKCEFKGAFLIAEDTYASGKTMKPTKGEKLPYNAWLRTKLVGVMAGNLLKAGSPYRKFYDNYKHRKESAGWGVSDGHRHNASMRYMVKMLLIDIWKLWREHEKLEVRPSYAEQYLGLKHHG